MMKLKSNGADLETMAEEPVCSFQPLQFADLVFPVLI